jgi:hypothetical protein
VAIGEALFPQPNPGKSVARLNQRRP